MLQESVRVENNNLPVQVDANLVMTQIELDNFSKSMIYHFTMTDVATIADVRFDRKIMKRELLTGCQDYKDILGPTLEYVVFAYHAVDGTTFEENISAKECGF
jgi:hypothetical protein